MRLTEADVGLLARILKSGTCTAAQAKAINEVRIWRQEAVERAMAAHREARKKGGEQEQIAQSALLAAQARLADLDG